MFVDKADATKTKIWHRISTFETIYVKFIVKSTNLLPVNFKKAITEILCDHTHLPWPQPVETAWDTTIGRSEQTRPDSQAATNYSYLEKKTASARKTLSTFSFFFISISKLFGVNCPCNYNKVFES